MHLKCNSFSKKKFINYCKQSKSLTIALMFSRFQVYYGASQSPDRAPFSSTFASIKEESFSKRSGNVHWWVLMNEKWQRASPILGDSEKISGEGLQKCPKTYLGTSVISKALPPFIKEQEIDWKCPCMVWEQKLMGNHLSPFFVCTHSFLSPEVVLALDQKKDWLTILFDPSYKRSSGQ